MSSKGTTYYQWGRMALVAILLWGQSSVVAAQRMIPPLVDNMTDTGIASYYHPHFNGWSTSTGETFSSKKMTAASNTLPLNTYVKVTDLSNDHWVIVRVNDRMHKGNRRLIDLSGMAAKKLGMIYDGLIKVEVQVIPKKFYRFFGLAPGEPLRTHKK